MASQEVSFSPDCKCIAKSGFIQPLGSDIPFKQRRTLFSLMKCRKPHSFAAVLRHHSRQCDACHNTLTLLMAWLSPSRCPSRRCPSPCSSQRPLVTRSCPWQFAPSSRLRLASLGVRLVAIAPRLTLFKSLEYSRKHLEELLKRKNNSFEKAYTVCRVFACL